MSHADTTAKVVKELPPIFYIFSAWIVAVIEASEVPPAVVYIMGASFVVDYLMALIASFKNKLFSSRVGFVGFVSKMLGIVLVILVAMLLKLVGIKTQISITMFFVIMSLNDMLSAFRHWYNIRTGKTLPEYDAITAFIKAVHDYLRKFVDRQINRINPK